ncbi:MAG: aminotransferase class V-fold PLP-dependent enzyme [Anaerolineae bacterium]
MDIYAELAVVPVINAAGPVTILGGSLMPPEVLAAMQSAASAFVSLDELHLAAGRHIAALLGVEAAHVCSGASAGIALMAAACMAGCDRERIGRLPDSRGMPSRFVVQRPHRNGFDRCVPLAGGTLVTVPAEAAAIRTAIDGNTAALYYTAAAFAPGADVPLPEVADIAHAAGLPLIVDAAAQVPPAENLTRFLAQGADLVAFSGGKALRGPQSSGLILGRADLVEACRLNDNPHMAIGRPMKASKEDIAGLVKAVELYVRKDHGADMALWERRVGHIVEALSGLAHVSASRKFPYGIAQQVPTAAVSWDEAALGLTHADAVRLLLAGRPRIAVRLLAPGSEYHCESPELRLYPDHLQEGEEVVVARRLRQLLAR